MTTAEQWQFPNWQGAVVRYAKNGELLSEARTNVLKSKAIGERLYAEAFRELRTQGLGVGESQELAKLDPEYLTWKEVDHPEAVGEESKLKETKDAFGIWFDMTRSNAAFVRHEKNYQ